MRILWFVQLSLHKRNFPEKPGRAKTKFSFHESRLDTVLTSFPVYLVLAPLLALFQGVNSCANPMGCTTIITQMQVSRKTRKS